MNRFFTVLFRGVFRALSIIYDGIFICKESFVINLLYGLWSSLLTRCRDVVFINTSQLYSTEV